MMIRSMPPASAHLALMPVPAPPPMIGLPAATWARRRLRHSSRVKKLMARSQGSGVRGQWRYDAAYCIVFFTMPILLPGTLDTKGAEYQFVRDLLRQHGLETCVIDTGVTGFAHFPPDIPRH